MAQLKDLIVTGASRLIGDVFTNKIQITTLNAPTSSGGTTYSAGTNGYVLKSNGSSIYWSTDTVGTANYAAVAGRLNVSSTDNAITRFNGTNGTIQNSTAIIEDSGTMKIKGKLVVDPAYDTSNNSFNEGVRINQASNGWAEIFIGGAKDSTAGSASSAWVVGRRGAVGGKVGAVGDLTLEEDSTGDGLTIHKSSGGATLYTNKAADLGCFNIKNVASIASSRTTWSLNATNANMAAGASNVLLVGQADSSKNAAYIGFHYEASGSNNNYLKLGMYSADDQMIIKGNGNVGIGTTAPSNKLEVSGNIKSSTELIAGTRVTSTSPSSETEINRITITPYFHTGGPWYIKSADDSTNAHLKLYYGSSQLIKLKHDGTFLTTLKASISGNANTATTAGFATTASQATHAATANSATTASQATHAATANSAGTAGFATTASQATHAATANTASTAGFATTASLAIIANQLNEFVVSTYDLPAAKGVRITYPSFAPVLISVQRSNSGGRLILLGGGYGAEGTVRNDFTEVVSSTESSFTWSLPNSTSISCSIEIMNPSTSGNATVVVWTKSAVTFTQITALTTEKQNKPLLNSSNYTNYTVTKTGTGASGTWPISISGKAASANSATTAAEATHAATANTASTAGYATTAGFATTAGRATTAGNATDATKLPLAGGQMTGPITWKDGTALPEFSNAPTYLLGIEAFASGGTTKWKSATAVRVGSSATADQAKWLMNRGTNVTIADSSWAHGQKGRGGVNTTNGTVWKQKWTQSGLTYTPSSGTATTLSDSGDIVYWLSQDSNANNLWVNMAIDGYIYTHSGIKILTQSAAYNEGIRFVNTSGTDKASINADTNGTIGIYGSKIALRPEINNATKGLEVTTTAVYPTTSIALGSSSNKWSNVYATTFNGWLNGTATTATQAVHAATANSATTASQATHAATANSATTASNATTAGYATTAARATTAGNATDATKLPLAGGTMTGPVAPIGKDSYIAYPSDGFFTNSSNSITGYIKIKLPKTTSATMFSFQVTIYNYVNDQSAIYYIAGYNYTDASWNAVTGYSITPLNNAKGDLPLRFLSNGTDMYVCIGNTDTTWSYPKAYIHDITTGHSNATFTNWSSGWTITLENTAFVSTEVKKTIEHPNIAINSTYATTANSATTASQATHAATANSATTATEATHASTANSATTATQATHAATANSATTASEATHAATANSATTASQATHAATANFASSANFASTANYATTATKAAAANITTTVNAVAKYSTTTGTFANSGVIIDSSNNITTTGTIWSGGATQTSEKQVGASSSAGRIYIYASGTTTGNRGIYTFNNAGTASSVISINKDNGITFNGNANTATTASNATQAGKLTTARTIWGQSFDGSANISGNMTGVGPQLKLPANETAYSFLTSAGGAGQGKFQKLLLSDNYSNGDLSTYRLDCYGGSARIYSGTLAITNNSNTTTIGSQNNSFCHFTNSANIPFYFNKTVVVNGQVKQYDDAVTSMSWINGRDSAAVRVAKYNSYHAGLSMKTTNGSWEVGVYTNDNLWFTYASDANYNANTNTVAQTHISNDGKVWGAVWNDYAEYRKDNPKEKQQPGRCVRETGKGDLVLTTKRLERGCEIISDTFGFAIGEDQNNGYNTPIASNGRVLAYPYESIEKFEMHIGWPVCSGPDGTVSIMSEEEEEKYPSRIIGTISEIPDYEEWGTGKVKVDGRVWIRIR